MPYLSHTRKTHLAQQVSAWLLVVGLLLVGAGSTIGDYGSYKIKNKDDKKIKIGYLTSEDCQPDCPVIDFTALPAFYKVKAKAKYLDDVTVDLNGERLFDEDDFEKKKYAKATVLLDDINELEVSLEPQSSKKDGKFKIEFKLYAKYAKYHGSGSDNGDDDDDDDGDDSDDDGGDDGDDGGPSCVVPCPPMIIVVPPACGNPCVPLPDPEPLPILQPPACGTPCEPAPPVDCGNQPPTPPFDPAINTGVNTGVNTGYNAGDNSGWNSGYNSGNNAGLNTWCNSGDNYGINHGSNSGINTEYNVGINAGINVGTNSGTNNGMNLGWNRGHVNDINENYNGPALICGDYCFNQW